MLAELSEDAATGIIAEIYGEIRRLWAVPYVSSLQRHLATRPGWLEWSWSALGPAFQSGAAQTAGWRLAADLDFPRLAPMDAADLDVDPAGLQTIRDVCASFVRVAPVNLIFAGLLRRLMNGERPDGGGWPEGDWHPPAAMPALPAMADVDTADDVTRAALLRLGTDVDGTPFVPGLYRILARWPALLSHLDVALAPLAKAPETEAARAALLRGIDGAVMQLFAEIPPPQGGDIPAFDDRAAVIATLDTYRRTSPEMVIFGQVIGNGFICPS
jgi:hypothetical protein